MASTNDIFGQIGAAKIFAGSVSGALSIRNDFNAAQIKELEQQRQETTDEKERKYIDKQIKRLKRGNKIRGGVQKAAQGATDFLSQLLEYVDIGKQELVKWLANYIIYVLPSLEIAVKMLLLTNIKKMVSCSLDPRIPDKFREEGILINEKEIDPRQILRSSPYSVGGKYNYFGIYQNKEDTDGIPLFSLTRATDMNAFIWFAKNCAKWVNPTVVGDNLSDFFEVKSGATLYNTHIFKGKDAYRYLPGCTFKQSEDANTIFVCLASQQLDGEDCYYIHPTSNTWTSVNWYKVKNIGTSIAGGYQPLSSIVSKATTAKPLFSLEYMDEYNSTAQMPRGNFKFKILPKPFRIAGGFVTDLGNNINVIGDAVGNPIQKLIGGNDIAGMNSGGALMWPGIQSAIPHTARFNEDGTYSKKGKYSICEEKFFVSEITRQADANKIVLYKLISKTDSTMPHTYLWFHPKQNKFYLCENKPETNDTEPKKVSPLLASSILTECYMGLTVYQFNYDYIFSFKLFDAQVIAANIINSLLNIDCINLSFLKKKKKNNEDDAISNTDQVYINSYVDKLVEKIIEQEDEEFTDCFYTFSNEDYDELEESTATKIINNNVYAKNTDEEVGEIYDILNSYDADSTLHEQTEIISRAIMKAVDKAESSATDDGDNESQTVQESTSGGRKNKNFWGNLLKKAVQILISEIVNAILTPKVLMLLQINKKLMNDDPLSFNKKYKYTTEDVLKGLSGLLSGIIKEVIDMIQKELLRLILSRITEIFNAYLKQLALEYAKKWVDLLRQLLACFKFRKKKMKGGNGFGDDRNAMTDAINAALNEVDYADIDMLVDEIMPNTNNC